MNQSPEEYLVRIEAMFDQCRKDRLDRFSVEWGKFSHDMNSQLRVDVENARDAKLRSRYNYVFVFWIEMSRCLQQSLPDFASANRAKEQAMSDNPLNMEINDEERKRITLEGLWT